MKCPISCFYYTQSRRPQDVNIWGKKLIGLFCQMLHAETAKNQIFVNPQSSVNGVKKLKLCVSEPWEITIPYYIFIKTCFERLPTRAIKGTKCLRRRSVK